jgi:N-acetylmuramoyl-L-alanine amidase
MRPTHIVIHHSATQDGKTVSWNAIRWYHVHTHGWRDIGYHAGVELIDTEYEILLGRMLTEPGAHCVDAGMNSKSIGICVVGNFDLAPPATKQLDLVVRLTRSLMDLLSIPTENVHRHSDFAKKTCPGKLFPWAEFIGRLHA